MSCPKRNPARTRQLIKGLFASGPAAAALQHRLNQCCHGSDCGWPCKRFVTEWGVAGVWCVNLTSSEKINLRDALADPKFKCPRDLF